MLNCSPDFSLDHCIDSLPDLIELIKRDTPTSRETFQRAFMSSHFSQLIKQIVWPDTREALLAFKSNTSLITNDITSEKTFKRGRDTNVKLVNLQMLSLRWMLQDGNAFCDFVYYLKQQNNMAWFGEPLV